MSLQTLTNSYIQFLQLPCRQDKEGVRHAGPLWRVRSLRPRELVDSRVQVRCAVASFCHVLGVTAHGGQDYEQDQPPPSAPAISTLDHGPELARYDGRCLQRCAARHAAAVAFRASARRPRVVAAPDTLNSVREYSLSIPAYAHDYGEKAASYSHFCKIFRKSYEVSWGEPRQGICTRATAVLP